MKSLSVIKNIHQNKTVLVCGCGESLNDLTHPERFITIGVNDIGRRFHPDYLVVVNPPGQFSGDRFRYVESSKAGYLFTQLDLPVQHPNIIKFKLGQLGGTDFSNKDVLNYTNNSPYIAINLAILMGAKRIGLIGVDFTDHHFFAKTGRHPLTPQFEKINRQYCRLAEAAQSAGIEIFNLSRTSRLTAFPKISIDKFEGFSHAKSTEKQPPLKIVSYATTPIAGVPAILARCINARTNHSARCVWATNSYGNGVEFAGDVEWIKNSAEAESLLDGADLIIAHNGKTDPRHERFFKGKPVITMAHNYLWNVDEQFVKKGLPGAVVGQYQAVLPEFDGWSVVPNPIPLWEDEYQPGDKPEEITICYTPSGKHEKYPAGHKLYWHSKGYETTIKILEKLSRKYPLRLEVIGDRQIPHAESLAMKRRSHIVIDECVTGSYHRNSLEGLAAASVVINGIGILPEVAEILRFCAGGDAAVPFVPATLENLEEVLKSLIEDRESLAEKGRTGRVWLEKNWDFERQWSDFWVPLVEASGLKAGVGRESSKRNSGGAAMKIKESKKFKEGVSVVIPHGGWNRLPHLRACLANLRQCPEVREVIVVEMDAVPHALEIARRWADKYVFLRRTDLFERARTLNVGSAFAECEYVLWLDNDLLISNDFPRCAVSELNKQNLDFLLPFSEIRYLCAADSKQVSDGVLNPDTCRPIKIYTNTMTEGGTGLVRREFLSRFGGIPDGFRGWGGEDNGWMHKVRLLGKAGRTVSRKQTVFHLYHALSGGNGGNAHILANPHYQNNADYLVKIKETSDAASFLREFPPAPVRLCEKPAQIYFISDSESSNSALIPQLKSDLNERFGFQISIITGDELKKGSLIKSGRAFVIFGNQNLQLVAADSSLKAMLEKTIFVADEPSSVRSLKVSGAQQVFALVTANSETQDPFEIKSETGIWNFDNTGDRENLSLTLAQTLCLLVNRGPAVPNLQSRLNVWVYWEGDVPEWIETCRKTIQKNVPDVRFLTRESFGEIWTDDLDIDISRLLTAHRADFIRAYLLAKFGGMWIDADCLVMRDPGFLFEKLDANDFIAHRERSGLFSNGFMTAKKDSLIAREFYQRICRRLRENRPVGWVEIGSQPLNETLIKSTAPFLELDCREVQPICWTQPEKFFAAGNDSVHRLNLNGDAICYMLSNTAIKKHQAANPDADLTAEDSFFSFAARTALAKPKVANRAAKTGRKPKAGQMNGLNYAAANNGDRRRSLAFYLEVITRIAPQRVFDADVGLGRWAVLLRDYFESSRDRERWRISVGALVEKKPDEPAILGAFYDQIHVGKLDSALKSVKESQDLIILGNYLVGREESQTESILSLALNASDYVFLNLPYNGNFGGGLFEYLSSHPGQVADFQKTDGSFSLVLSRDDPKKLRPRSETAEIFLQTAENNALHDIESISGPGSSLDSTAEIRRRMPLLIADLGISSMLDAPCGDFNWLRVVELRLEKYIGLDIIPSLIEQNQKKYAIRGRNFAVGDITRDFLPKSDLIFCRDCLVHLSYDQISSALSNFSESGAEFLLTTTFPAKKPNTDIQTGDWRPLNLQLPPFSFPEPLRLLNERCIEGGGVYSDKSLGLWRLSDLRFQIS